MKPRCDNPPVSRSRVAGLVAAVLCQLLIASGAPAVLVRCTDSQGRVAIEIAHETCPSQAARCDGAGPGVSSDDCSDEPLSASDPACVSRPSDRGTIAAPALDLWVPCATAGPACAGVAVGIARVDPELTESRSVVRTVVLRL